MRVVSEETYLAQNGASRQDIGDAALHRQPGSTPNSRDRAVKSQAALDAKLLARRVMLRIEYEDKVAAGELRPPTAQETRIATARGMPENASVRAARRILVSRFGYSPTTWGEIRHERTK